MQLQALSQLGELQEEIETSIIQQNEKLKIYNLENLEIDWQDHLPGYEALKSIAAIKNELLRISPVENIRVPVNSDLQTKRNGILLRKTFSLWVLNPDRLKVQSLRLHLA